MSTTKAPLISGIATTPAPDPALLETGIRAIDPHVVLVTVRGEIDADGLAEFADAIDAGLRPTALVTVVDLTGIRLLPDRGVTVLLDASRAARLRHVSLRLVGLQPQLRRALDVAGPGYTFDHYLTVDAALRHRPVIDDT